MTTIVYRFDREGQEPLSIDWENGEAAWEGVSFLGSMIVEICKKIKDLKGTPTAALKWSGFQGNDYFRATDADWEKARKAWEDKLQFVIDNIDCECDDLEEQSKRKDDGALAFAEIYQYLWD